MAAIPLDQIDAFTDRPFRGNPAAVCVLRAPADPAWMQSLAEEMRLSETAFVHPRDDGAWGLRWFTPAVEVDLCGHATLASAHCLVERGLAGRGEPVRFVTRVSGTLTCRAEDGGFAMDFPATAAEPATAPAGLAEALGAEPVRVARGPWDWLAELADEAAVRALAPDFAALAAYGERGVVVTAPGSGEFDFVSRFFVPGCGIDEDPVTGSTHCMLAGWWGERLGKAEMTAFQASARGGVVRVRRAGDRVVLSGRAVTVLRGELAAPPPPSA